MYVFIGRTKFKTWFIIWKLSKEMAQPSITCIFYFQSPPNGKIELRQSVDFEKKITISEKYSYRRVVVQIKR